MKKNATYSLNVFCMLSALLLFFTFNVTHASADDFYVIAGSAGVGTEIKSLPCTISAPGFYYIKKDLSCAAGTHGITINADNVTLDLMGFSLVGPGSVGDYSGIYMDARFNVEIRNGTVRNFSKAGIDIQGDGSGHRIINIRAKDNGGSGIYAHGRNTIVKNSTSIGNGGYGIYAYYDSIVSGNTCSFNSNNGIYSYGTGTVTGNICSNNTGSGISASNGSTINGNTCSFNSNNGIYTTGSSMVTGNTCYFNNSTGIVGNDSTITENICCRNDEGISAGSGSTVVGNTCRSNTNLGINLAGDNLVDQNTATDNGTNRNSCATCTFGTNHTPQ